MNVDDRHSSVSDEDQLEAERERRAAGWFDEPSEAPSNERVEDPEDPGDPADDSWGSVGELAGNDAFEPGEPLEEPEAMIGPTGWSDPTSTDGPRYWDRLVSSERGRISRYHRPATVVLIEVVGLDELEALAGADLSTQLLFRIGRALTAQIRSGDHAAHIDVARFGVYLPETNEVDAINFVERARTALEAEAEFAVPSVRIAIGWASPTDGDLDVALELAQRRLDLELAPGV